MCFTVFLKLFFYCDFILDSWETSLELKETQINKQINTSTVHKTMFKNMP